jgi:hypothetical protein
LAPRLFATAADFAALQSLCMGAARIGEISVIGQFDELVIVNFKLKDVFI